MVWLVLTVKKPGERFSTALLKANLVTAIAMMTPHATCITCASVEAVVGLPPQ